MPIELLFDRPGFPVHGAGVVGQRLAARPIHVLVVQALLADHPGIAGPRNGDAPQDVGTDGFSRRFQDGPWIHKPGRLLCRERRADARHRHKKNTPSSVDHGRSSRPCYLSGKVCAMASAAQLVPAVEIH